MNGRPIRFYVACDYARKDDAKRIAKLLADDLNWEVLARWVTEQPVLYDNGLGGELEGSDALAAQTVAQQDLDDISRSEVFIQLTTGEKARGGRHVELGYAIAMARPGSVTPIVTVGPREHAFHYHPGVTSVPDEAGLLLWARGFSAGLGR